MLLVSHFDCSLKDVYWYKFHHPARIQRDGVGFSKWITSKRICAGLVWASGSKVCMIYNISRARKPKAHQPITSDLKLNVKI